MTTSLTRRHVWRIMWAVSTAAGLLVLVGVSISAMTHSGKIALGAFAIGFTAIFGAGLILLPAWRKTTPG